MKSDLIFDTVDCIKLIKKKYPYIPIWIIKRVLFGQDLYMHKIGIIDWKPTFNMWDFPNKKLKP